MKIAQTCQGDTLANLDQEGPNVKKQQKYVMQTQLHGTTFRRLDYKGDAASQCEMEILGHQNSVNPEPID